MNINAEVGERLRRMRADRGLSLSELARRSGVGKATLSELEGGRRNPTLETLYALTTALNQPLSAVLPDPGAATAGGGTVRVSGAAVDALLVSRLVEVEGATEVYDVTIRPGTEQLSTAHVAGTTEHLVVLSGRARAGSVREPAVVGPGQSHSWASDAPHVYAAAGPDPVRAVLVVHYPAAP